MRQVLLLRGINLGPKRRVPMAELREAMTEAGFEAVETYLRSGNVILDSTLSGPKLAKQAQKIISERFDFDVPVLVRSASALGKIVKLNPLGDVASDPKRYQVTFLDSAIKPRVAAELEALATDSERLVAKGREIYAWHPDGIGRSKLAAQLAGKDLGATATSRNWQTVTKLFELAY